MRIIGFVNLCVHFLHKFRILHTMKRRPFRKQIRKPPGRLVLSIAAVFALLSLSSCLEDVPHDNPLDPASGNSGFRLNGKVQTYYAPYNPLNNALIWLEPGSYVGRSAADGTYGIGDIETGVYHVICSADGYRNDTLQLQITGNTSANFNLDALPRFVHHTLTMHHIARWFPLPDVYYLEISANVADPDGLADIKQVGCEIPYSALTDTLNPALNAGEFKKTFFTQDLNITSLQELLGQAVFLWVEDNPGARVRSEAQYAARVIEKTASLSSPVELQAVRADSIHFQWDLNPLPYSHTLRIDIYAINAGIVTPVKTIEGIESARTDWLYRSSLPAGDYFWTVTIVDTFGNTSQSKEQVFQIL